MQKDSIKREQSQAGLSFAEREKFRPQVKKQIITSARAALDGGDGESVACAR